VTRSSQRFRHAVRGRVALKNPAQCNPHAYFHAALARGLPGLDGNNHRALNEITPFGFHASPADLR
jgi:hypothetical protein